MAGELDLVHTSKTSGDDQAALIQKGIGPRNRGYGCGDFFHLDGGRLLAAPLHRNTSGKGNQKHP